MISDDSEKHVECSKHKQWGHVEFCWLIHVGKIPMVRTANDKNTGIHQAKQHLLASERSSVAAVVIVVKTMFSKQLIVDLLFSLAEFANTAVAWVAERPRFWSSPGRTGASGASHGLANIWNVIEVLCWFDHISAVVVAVDQIGTRSCSFAPLLVTFLTHLTNNSYWL